MEDGGNPYLISILIAIIVILVIALVGMIYTFRKSISKRIKQCDKGGI